MACTVRSRLMSLTLMCEVVVSGWLIACRSPVGPLPPDAASMQPRAVYERWWAMTEQCSGRSGELSAVRWYQAPGDQVWLDGKRVQGYWASRGNAIVLAGNFTVDGGLVRHEMLHALLRERGHPRAQFLGACAGLVDCEDSCIEEASPWSHPADATVVPLDSIELSTKSELLPPERDGDRFFTLRVQVTNPGTRSVLVAVPPDVTEPPVFGYDVRGSNGGISLSQVASDSSRLFLAPHQTKEWLYEFLVSDKLTYSSLPPGLYLVRGSYLDRWTAGTWTTIAH